MGFDLTTLHLLGQSHLAQPKHHYGPTSGLGRKSIEKKTSELKDTSPGVQGDTSSQEQKNYSKHRVNAAAVPVMGERRERHSAGLSSTPGKLPPDARTGTNKDILPWLLSFTIDKLKESKANYDSAQLLNSPWWS